MSILKYYYSYISIFNYTSILKLYEYNYITLFFFENFKIITSSV